MPRNLRGKPVDEIAVTTGEVVSDVGCGVVSIVFTAVKDTASTLKLYDNATEVSGNVKKALSAGSFNETVVYCPSKPDAYSNGVVVVITGTGAKAYIEIEP